LSYDKTSALSWFLALAITFRKYD